MAQPKKKQDPQIAHFSSSGFLALPRELVRLCWHHLRLKEIALLVALIDLADGRWSVPFALVELAKLAHLSAGNARETAAHLERVGLISREQTGPGIYRWRLASEGYQQIAHQLANRPRLKVRPRPLQTSLAFEPIMPSAPAPAPRLAIVPPPLLSFEGMPVPAPVPLPPERAPTPPTLDPPDVPDTVPAPPPAPDTEEIPDFDPDPYPYIQPGPETASAFGLPLGRIVQLAARPFGEDDILSPAPIQGASRPNSGRPAAPIQGAPRPNSGRPLLMISKPSPDREQNPVNRSAQERMSSSEKTDGTEKGSWTAEQKAALVALTIELSGPDLHPSPVRLRLASLENLLIPAALVERFLREEIPAARQRGARYPFAAAFSRWSAWQEEQTRKATPARPLLAPLASPPAIRQVGDGRRAPSVPQAQRNANLEGARGVLAALRGTPIPRPGLSPAGGQKP